MMCSGREFQSCVWKVGLQVEVTSAGWFDDVTNYTHVI